jgi:predicted DNA-binding antitoxin AbrB/MazE fold protein
MSEIITAVYENGLLRPTIPLRLQEHQVVKIRLVEDSSSDDQTLQRLIESGIVTPPPRAGDGRLISEQALRSLAEQVGKVPGKQLSESIIEDRGER